MDCQSAGELTGTGDKDRQFLTMAIRGVGGVVTSADLDSLEKKRSLIRQSLSSIGNGDHIKITPRRTWNLPRRRFSAPVTGALNCSSSLFIPYNSLLV